MKKYEPLGNYLTDLQSWETEVTLTFEQVEMIIGAKLPDSAFKYRGWWANQESGSRAPHWHEAGFKVKPVSMTQKEVTFRRLGGSAKDTNEIKWLKNPNFTELTNAIEKKASGFAFGDLQSIRQKLKGLKWRSSTIFKKSTIFEKYAFHFGGRKELQFNVGLELDNNNNQQFRHGLAISLRSGPSIPQISENILRRIARLNEFIELHAEDFTDFFMYESRYDSDEWSGYHDLRPISPKVVKLNAFIFIGKCQSPLHVSIEQILHEFDRLLPMYIFVESDEVALYTDGVSSSVFEPGLTKKPSSSAVSMTERKLNKALRHNDIQFALGQYLARRHGKDKVRDEFATANGKRVDLVVKEDNNLIFYEIKVCESAQHCIRQAIGQLLEYSYWPGASRATKLIVVGELSLDQEAQDYLESLRKEFGLPIQYQQFDMESTILRNC